MRNVAKFQNLIRGIFGEIFAKIGTIGILLQCGIKKLFGLYLKIVYLWRVIINLFN